LNIKLTSSVLPPTPCESNDQPNTDILLVAYAKTIDELKDRKARAKKEATTIRILSVHDPGKTLDPPASLMQGQPKNPLPSAKSVKKPPKQRNFLGQRLVDEKTALQNARRSTTLYASNASGGKSESVVLLNPPIPSRFSTSTHDSRSARASRIKINLIEFWEAWKGIRGSAAGI